MEKYVMHVFLTGFPPSHQELVRPPKLEQHDCFYVFLQPLNTQSLKGLVRLSHVFPYLWHTCHFWISALHIFGQPLLCHPRIRYSECSVDLLFTNPKTSSFPPHRSAVAQAKRDTKRDAVCSLTLLESWYAFVRRSFANGKIQIPSK